MSKKDTELLLKLFDKFTFGVMTCTSPMVLCEDCPYFKGACKSEMRHDAEKIRQAIEKGGKINGT